MGRVRLPNLNSKDKELQTKQGDGLVDAADENHDQTFRLDVSGSRR